MNRYVLEERIGEGTFGTVYRAKKKGDPVKFYAVKKLKRQFPSWKDVSTEREFHAIAALMTKRTTKKRQHPRGAGRTKDTAFDEGHSDHLVRFYEILREQDSCLYFVMEHMAGGSLRDYIAEKQSRRWNSASKSPANSARPNTFDDSEARSILFQSFRGLCHVHSKGLVHRDVKPENILLNGRTAKLADFSLARPLPRTDYCCTRESCCGTHSASKNSGNTAVMATNYVGTRWYRAPELLRPDDVENDCFFEGSCFYTKAIDVFSMACVAAELHRCAPLFLSKDESEQLRLIEELLLETKPPVGGSDVSRHDVSETIVENRLKDAIPTNDPRALSLIRDCLQLCPERRPNADEVLCHGYFEREYHVATFGGENDENPAHARFSPANSTRPPASDVLPDQTHMEDPRKHMSPSAAPTTGIITPTPVDWATINFESTNPPKEKERVGRPFLNNSEGINALGMNRTPPFHTPKRQKLRPSQIFNID